MLLRPLTFRQFQGWEAEESFTDAVEVPAGAVVTVVSESNAGFRGIEATVALDDGRTTIVSTGALRFAR